MQTPRLAWALASAVLSLATARPFFAQEVSFAGREATEIFNGLQILSTKEAIADLGLNADQVEALAALRADYVAMTSERQRPLQNLPADERKSKMEAVWQELAAEGNRRLGEIFTAEQFARYYQIMLQVRGYAAFLDPKVQAALTFTDEQKARLTTIRDELITTVSGLRAASGNDRQAMSAKAAEAYQKAASDSLAVLTDEQKTRWSKLVGDEFQNPRPIGGPRPAVKP